MFVAVCGRESAAPSPVLVGGALRRRMILACPHCGALQEAPDTLRRGRKIACRLCDSPLELTGGRSLDAALALSAATFVVLFPAYLLPIGKVELLGATHESYAASGALMMWAQGWPVLGMVVGLFGVVLPFLRFGLLTVVLAAIRRRRGGVGIGRLFRWACALETWAMPDVLLLGYWVATTRLTAQFPMTFEIGTPFFVAAGVGALLSRATLDKRAAWRAIAPERADAPQGASLSCPACDLVLPAETRGGRCPRCAERLHPRRPDALNRTAALTAAGLLLYVPANALPTVIIVQRWLPQSFNIVTGIKQIFSMHMFGLGLLVSATSFAIPALKLIALGWFVLAIRRRSRAGLKLRTGVYRVVDEIGRWSMAEPFTISFVLPLMQYGQLTSSLTGAGSMVFSGVVVLTLLASRAYDPRLGWDAAEGARAA